MGRKFVSGRTVQTDAVRGRLYPGLGADPTPGVLVLHGGGGARGYEQTYAALLAEYGYTAFCVEYFEAPGVRDRPLEVPLEEIGNAADWLLERPDVAGDRVGVVGFSRGGEASLLVGSHFDAIGAVAAYVPSCYVWPAPSWMDGIGEGEPTWTLDGEPLPHLPIDKYVYEDDGIDEPLGVPEPNPGSLAIKRSTAAEKERAEIPVESIDGPVLVVSGGNDTVWPSTLLAERVTDRLAAHDHPWPFEHLSFPDAGHAIRVPYRFRGDTDPAETHRFGGTHEANGYASACTWQATLEYLDRIHQ